jgi:hypothetical protein
MSVSFYPSQEVTIAGKKIPTVQSASVEFTNPKRAVYKFGQFLPIGSVRSELGTANLTVTWAVGKDAGGGGVIGVSNLSDKLNDFTNGVNCSVKSGGTFDMNKAFLTSFTAQGAVGDIATCTATFTSTEATFTASAQAPGIPTTVSASQVAPFDKIVVSLNGANFAKSFNFSVDIPREYITRLGSLTPVANIPTAAPTVKFDAELILGAGAVSFNKDDVYNASVNLDGYNITVSKMRLGNFQTNAVVDGVATATVSLEQELENFANVKF